MKTAKTVLALLLCLCMLPFSALAVTIQPGGAVSYTPAESGLYAVSVQKDGKPLDPLPAKAAIYEPAMAVSVTAGEAAAQAVDYNVFYLVKGTQYSVQLKNISDGAYDDAGEWDVSVQPVKINALSLNADTLVEGEWFSFTPDADGSYAITAASAPVFVEVLTEDASVSGDWAGYALDKEKCRVGMELDYLRSLKAAIALRAEELDLAEDAYNKALNKLDNYNDLIDLANKTGIGGEDSNLGNKKQAVYDALKHILGNNGNLFELGLIRGLFPNLNLPTLDPEVVADMPDNVEAFPDWLSARLQSQNGLVGEAKAKYDNLKAEQEADQARYDAGLAANPQLADLVENTSTETATLRQQVKTDADAIMSGAAALAADAAGMKLVAADWQNTGSSSLSVTLAKGVTYIIHALSNLTTSASVTDSSVTPPEPTVDKTALNEAITDAKAVDTDLYTEDSVAAMQEALGKAEAVQKNDAATQTEVDDAAKALNDAVKALKKKDDPTPQTVDKSALEKAIADAKAVEAGLYTEDTVAAMQEALGKAEDVQKNDAATQAEVDAAAKALNAAIKALKEKPAEVDKTALNEAIKKAEAIERDKYTDNSLRVLDAALNAAKKLAESDSALVTQGMVDFAANALNAAFDALQEIEPSSDVDKSALESAIAAAKAVDKEKYTEDSVAAMQEALSKAEEVNSKADATQDEIDAAAAALNQAVAALKAKESAPDVNKSSLQQLVSYVDQLDRSKYTDESLAALDAAQKTGKDVLADDKADQTAVDNAIKALTKAITGLKAKDAAPDPAKCDGGANCPSKQYRDVDQTKWYHEAVDYAIVNNLFNGTSDTTFAPNGTMTRGMLVTVLHRMAGEPAASAPASFTDLRQGWYRDAVAWAAENKIVEGISATQFAPDAKVTREQAMTMLMRYAAFKGYDVSARDNLAAFSDASSVSIWAQNAMQWAVAAGLIEGVTDTTIQPHGESTRAQIATILMRFQNNIAK